MERTDSLYGECYIDICRGQMIVYTHTVSPRIQTGPVNSNMYTGASLNFEVENSCCILI